MCHKYGVKRGVFCLSSCIYPALPSKFPMDETQIHEGPPHPSNEGYAYAKRMLELQCRQYNKAYNTEYICVVPVNLYGEYDNFSLKDGHVIPALMHRFHNTLVKNKLNNTNEKHIAYGTGKPLRQFLYAGDFATLICVILLDKTSTSTLPISCCGDELSIKSMIYILADAMDIDENDIVFDASMADGCMKKTVSNTKLLSRYPGFKFTSLQNGLKKTYEWFKENYDDIRK
jgi:GDP-L-fucose synthase